MGFSLLLALAWSDAAVLGGLAALVALGLAFLLRPDELRPEEMRPEEMRPEERSARRAA